MRYRLLVAVCLAGASLTPSLAAAEPFADLYVGGAFTSNSDATLSVSGASATGEIKWQSSVTAGGRVGYWFARPGWLGVALDVSFFTPDGDTKVIPISALVMFRAPLLVSGDYPHGRLQPYVGAGPGLFMSRASGDVGDGGLGTVSDTSVDLGLDVRGGVSYLVTKRLALFAEYKFTHVSPEFHFELVPGFTANVQTRFDTHHVVGGLSFRF